MRDKILKLQANLAGESDKKVIVKNLLSNGD
jgi:hypothetical protein